MSCGYCRTAEALARGEYDSVYTWDQWLAKCMCPGPVVYKIRKAVGQPRRTPGVPPPGLVWRDRP